MTTPPSLVEFLLARIDEDESAAKVASAVAVNTIGERNGLSEHDHWTGGVIVSRERLLAECAAKRRIIELHFEHQETIDGEWGCCHSAPQIRAGECDGSDDDLLLALAAPYASHSDFDPSWSLDGD